MRFYRVWSVLAHACIVLSLLLLTLLALDCINPAMLFLDSDPGRAALLLLCGASLAAGVCTAMFLGRRQRLRAGRERHARSDFQMQFKR